MEVWNEPQENQKIPDTFSRNADRTSLYLSFPSKITHMGPPPPMHAHTDTFILFQHARRVQSCHQPPRHAYAGKQATPVPPPVALPRRGSWTARQGFQQHSLVPWRAAEPQSEIYMKKVHFSAVPVNGRFLSLSFFFCFDSQANFIASLSSLPSVFSGDIIVAQTPPSRSFLGPVAHAGACD